MSDLISREAAIRKLQDKGEEPRYQHTDEDWKCGLFMAEDIINDLPAVEVTLCHLDSPCEYQNSDIAMPSAQPETPPYVAEIESEYKKWAGMPHINKPLAKALYEVWKKHDREDVSRNGDLISRKEAIDALSMMQGIVAENGVRKGISMAWQQIADLPPAQPEQKKGRWEYETMRHIMTGEMRTVRICSECGGGWFRYDLSDGVEDAEPNYCPNCGADMRGEEDE